MDRTRAISWIIMEGKMSRTRVIAALAAFLALGTGGSLLAHHETGGGLVRLEGRVAQFVWTSTMVEVHIDANVHGRTERWVIQGQPSSTLLRRGWTRTTLTEGSEVVVDAMAWEDGSKKAAGVDLTIKNGRKYDFGNTLATVRANRARAAAAEGRPLPDPSPPSPAPPESPLLSSARILLATIREYWGTDKAGAGHMSASLRAIADPKRADESATVRGYGSIKKVSYSRAEGPWKVFRIEHSAANVEWFVQDNGLEITALTWKKL